MLKIGDSAPDFSAQTTNGEPVSLSALRGRPVVIYFFPKAFTMGCTIETRQFRDNYAEIRKMGAEVIGISADTTDSHRRFSERFRLPFVLLADVDGAVRARYGVPRTLGIFPGRVTYLIDRDGIVRHIFSSQFQPWRHVTEAIRILEELRH